jgi:hypothetical protein
MRGQPPTTTWEVEAARHQEVVAAEFRPDRRSQTEGPARPGVRAAIMARLASLTSEAGRTEQRAALRMDREAPCPPGTIRAARPGA